MTFLVNDAITLAGDIDLDTTFKVINSAAPVAGTDLTNKDYVDAQSSFFQDAAAGTRNIIGGTNAGASLAGGATDNFLAGEDAGKDITTGDNNIMIGSRAGELIIGSNFNVGFGADSLKAVTTGASNTAIGNSAGSLADTTSASNVFIGPNSGPSGLGVVSNSLYIHTSASDTPLIGGDFSTGNVTFSGSLRFTERAARITTPAATFGELWVRNDGPNVLVFTDDTGTDTVLGAGGGGGSPGGADTQIQFNDSASFGGDADFTWAKANNTMSIGSVTTPGTIRSPDGSSSEGADLSVIAGNGVGTDEDGGNITITAGDASGGAGQDGAVILQSGQTGGGGGGGHIRIETDATERLRIGSSGAWNLGGGGAGTSGQVITSQGAGTPPIWASVSGLFTEDAQDNIFGGTGSGAALTGTALDNLLIGVSAGAAITTGDRNIFIGNRAGSTGPNTESDHTVVGVDAMTALVTSTIGNTALGKGAMENLTLGAANISIGVNSMQNAGTTLDSRENVVVGTFALQNADDSSQHTAIGYQTLQDLTASDGTVAVGHQSLKDMTAGEFTTAIGWNAGINVTGADNSIFIGQSSGPSAAGTYDDSLYIEAGDESLYADTPLIGGNFASRFIDLHGTIFIQERAAAFTDKAGYGQLWVSNTTPNELYYTDDAGTDINISVAAASGVQGSIGDVQYNDGGGPAGHKAGPELNFDDTGTVPALRVGDPATSTFPKLLFDGLGTSSHQIEGSQSGTPVWDLTFTDGVNDVLSLSNGGSDPRTSVLAGGRGVSILGPEAEVLILGELQLAPATFYEAENASLLMPTASGTPSPLVEGQMWKTASDLHMYLGGSDTIIASSGLSADVTKVGTPVDDEVGVWTGDGTIEGSSAFTFDGAVLAVGGICKKAAFGVGTTDATPTVLATIGVPSDAVVTATIRGHAFEVATGDTKSEVIHASVKNVGGTTSLIGSASVAHGVADAGAAAWTFAVTGDDTSDALLLTVTGEAAHTIAWDVCIEWTEA